MWPCAGWLAARWVWPWKAKKEPWKTKPSDKTFRRKTYLPKACNFHVQMPGTLNWRTKHARKKFTRCGLGAACWLRDGFDLGKRRRRSSTPAVVPGAAPALAKAGVGGYVKFLVDTLVLILGVSSGSKLCLTLVEYKFKERRLSGNFFAKRIWIDFCIGATLQIGHDWTSDF